MLFFGLAAGVLSRRRDNAERKQVADMLETEARQFIQSKLQRGAYAVSKSDVEQFAKTHVLQAELPPSTPAGYTSPPTPAARRHHMLQAWDSVKRRLDQDPLFRASTLSTHLGTEAAWAKADRVYQ